MKHSSGFWNGSKLSPSPSQETLRPSKPSTRILLGEEEDDDADMDWQPPDAFSNHKDMAGSQERFQSLQRTGSSSSLTGEPSGMRRTPSGMFMPYEEDEDDVVSEGLFGKVVDTVNTAKDIAHVIWNVGVSNPRYSQLVGLSPILVSRYLWSASGRRACISACRPLILLQSKNANHS
jgi:hypothetical protein